MLRLNSLGRLTLTDQNGRDFAPLGSKARGLLVLLAVTPDHTRTRAWLQARLWSDRAPEQAAGSLRGVLSEIRRALGPHRALLIASRHMVSLNPAGFRVTYEAPDEAQLGGELEPFEDVDVHDGEFEHLIRDIRRHLREKWLHHKGSSVGQRRIVLIRCETRGTPAAEVAARLFQDRILGALRQIDGLEVMGMGNTEPGGDAPNSAKQPQSLLMIRVLSVALADDVFLSCEIEPPQRGRILWSGSATVPASIAGMRDAVDLDQLALTTVERLCDAFADGESVEGAGACAFMLARHARDLFFRLDRKSLADADRLFRRAFEIEPRGKYLAWRSFLRNAAFFQHRSMSFFDDTTTMAELAVEALRHSPEDPTVQTIASQLDYIHQGSVQTPLLMVQRSVEADPTDPLGWAVLSNALAANGRREESYETALRAVKLSGRSPFQFYFEHFACMAAVALQNYERAMLHAKTSLRFRPDFVSIRRYEVALSLQRRDESELAQAVDALRQHEPDFSSSMLLDPTYPVNTLRRLPLIDAIR